MVSFQRKVHAGWVCDLQQIFRSHHRKMWPICEMVEKLWSNFRNGNKLKNFNAPKTTVHSLTLALSPMVSIFSWRVSDFLKYSKPKLMCKTLAKSQTKEKFKFNYHKKVLLRDRKSVTVRGVASTRSPVQGEGVPPSWEAPPVAAGRTTPPPGRIWDRTLDKTELGGAPPERTRGQKLGYPLPLEGTLTVFNITLVRSSQTSKICLQTSQKYFYSSMVTSGYSANLCGRFWKEIAFCWPIFVNVQLDI